MTSQEFLVRAKEILGFLGEDYFSEIELKFIRKKVAGRYSIALVWLKDAPNTIEYNLMAMTDDAGLMVMPGRFSFISDKEADIKKGITE